MARTLVVAVLVALAAPAYAQHPERQLELGVDVSDRACFDRMGQRIAAGQIGSCDDRDAKIYQDAFDKNEPVIELVTMGIGALIWERHGHIALCVRNKDWRRDICYNYGIGNFREPLNMTWGFFRGTKSFWAGEQRVLDLVGIYAGADRTIYAQPLPLDMPAKQKIIDKLKFDILEANKFYAYDHFWDNCTTRVRDIINKATDGALEKMPDQTDGSTYRDLARKGFYGMRVPLIITDIAMGRVTDREPSYYERMFLPDYLREAVQTKWGIKPVELYKRVGDPPLDDGPSGRVWFALIGLLLGVPTLLTRYLGRFQRLGLAVTVVPYVILGSILWFLAIISPLQYVEWNESLLVYLPLDVLLLGFLSPQRRQLYARVRVAMLALVVLADLVGILHQPLIAAVVLPLIPNAVVGFWRPEWSRAKPVPKAPQKSAKKK